MVINQLYERGMQPVGELTACLPCLYYLEKYTALHHCQIFQY